MYFYKSHHKIEGVNSALILKFLSFLLLDWFNSFSILHYKKFCYSIFKLISIFSSSYPSHATTSAQPSNAPHSDGSLQFFPAGFPCFSPQYLLCQRIFLRWCCWLHCMLWEAHRLCALQLWAHVHVLNLCHGTVEGACQWGERFVPHLQGCYYWCN